MASYEYTPYTIGLRPESSPGSVPLNAVECHDLFQDGSTIHLHGLLTSDEYARLIQQANSIGFQPCGYEKSMRVTDRLVAKSPELASIIFDRIRLFLQDTIDLRNDIPRGICSSFPKGQEWKPIGLNETFRLCRYQVGGFFQPHHDGGFDRRPTERSLKTFMLYLNDDFEGGATHFYNESGDPQKVIRTVQPRTGSALIFNSSITHDGGELLNGEKYILRSEVMYTPVQVKAEPRIRPDHGDFDIDSFQPDGY